VGTRRVLGGFYEASRVTRWYWWVLGGYQEEGKISRKLLGTLNGGTAAF